MKIAAYLRPTESQTNKKVIHFGEALGATFSTRYNPIPDCDLAITAGFQITRATADAMRRGIPLIILENPVWYDGDKSDTYTWAYNGLHGLGFTPDCNTYPDRPHPKLLPWKQWDEGDITIFGQVPTDKAIRGEDFDAWARTALEVLPQATYRPHPIMVPSKEWPEMELFEDCIRRTSLAVTFTSTCASETCIAGIPTIACHEGSLAYPVSSHNLSDNPITPCREEWIHSLAWRHWTTSERLNVGYILRGYDEALAQAQEGRYDNMSNGREQGPRYVTDNH